MPEALESVTMGEVSLPRFEDGAINLQELSKKLAEDVMNEIMDAETDQLCQANGTSRNGYRVRKPSACWPTSAPGCV